MQDDVACRRIVNIGKLIQSHIISIGTAKRQRAYFACLGPVAWSKNDRYIKNSIPFVNLPDNLAPVGCPYDIKDSYRIKTPTRDILLPQPHYNLRHAESGLDLDLCRPPDTGQHADDLLCFLIHMFYV